MNGQLWQKCFCGKEPVCCQCEKCERHCSCDKPDDGEKIPKICRAPYYRGLGQGFGHGEDGDY